MRKAYNVYTIIEKTSMRAAFRKFTLLFAFGVCFLGLQNQGSAQIYSFDQAAANAPTDYSFLRSFDFALTGEDAASVLRNQLRVVMNSPTETDTQDLDGLVRGNFLKSAIDNLMRDDEVYASLGKAFLATSIEPYVKNNPTSIDLQGIVEGYARLLD